MRPTTFIKIIVLLLSAGLVFGILHVPGFIPIWVLWIIFIISAAIIINDLLGKPVPFLRWSFLRVIFGMKTLLKKWQVGDGREEKVAETVLRKAPKGNPAEVIKVIDNFAYNDSMLINVGDRKGAILDAALERAKPKVILELGAYVGYSAIRMAQKLPVDGHLYSVEFSPDNAAIARKIINHAGLSDRITIVVGTLGDGGKTADVLQKDYSFVNGSVDFVFVDHDKEAYLTDLKLILGRGWLHKGSAVVADNIKFPGAPDYLAYMNEQEGKLWQTQSHKSYVEYQSMISDIVLESIYLG